MEYLEETFLDGTKSAGTYGGHYSEMTWESQRFGFPCVVFIECGEEQPRTNNPRIKFCPDKKIKTLAEIPDDMVRIPIMICDEPHIPEKFKNVIHDLTDAELKWLFDWVAFNKERLLMCGDGTIRASDLWNSIENAFFTDARDGQIYRTVKVGNQTWMAENLNFLTSFSLRYENNAEFGKKYGMLYTYGQALKAVPEGWRLPSYEDWETLRRYADKTRRYDFMEDSGEHLKSADGWKYPKDWEPPAISNGKDTYSFKALPGGYAVDEESGMSFHGEGNNGTWWGNSDDDEGKALACTLDNESCNLKIGHYEKETWFFSVRCIKNKT